MKEEIKENFSVDPDAIIPKQSQIEFIKSDEIILYIVNKEALFIRFNDVLLPSIQAILNNIITLPKVTIDKGAIPYIIKGAHIMVPGIIEIDPEVKKDSFVVIVDETHKKPIAIGKVVMDIDEIKKSNKGKAIENLHYVGDKIWNFLKQL